MTYCTNYCIPGCLGSVNLHGDGIDLGFILGRIQRSWCHIGTKSVYLGFDWLGAWSSLPRWFHILKQTLQRNTYYLIHTSEYQLVCTTPPFHHPGQTRFPCIPQSPQLHQTGYGS